MLSMSATGLRAASPTGCATSRASISVPGVPGKHFLKNLFLGRTLLVQLVKRDFAKRFVGSAGGWLWGVIQPLVMLLSWTFVFQICMKQEPPPGEVTNNYTVFLFSGFLPWLLFQETVTRSATS